MCHQSVGLIARAIEARGLPTVSLTSAWSITRAVNPPRAVYTDFPLGHTAGKQGDVPMQRDIMRAALRAITAFEQPGLIETLSWQWSSDDAWKDRVMRPKPPAEPSAEDRGDVDDRARGGAARDTGDDRVERHATPQYQTPEDEAAAAAAGTCPDCIWLT
ncbi:MAG: hypothetical protein ACKOZX_07985 [Gammaproteobacteria bacterium]